MKYLYIVTEENADGCGNSASEYVKFSEILTSSQLDTLAACLKTAKAEAADGSSTGNVIEAALGLFEARTGVMGKLAGCPFYGAVSF